MDQLPILDWQPNHDERSREYPVRSVLKRADVRRKKMWRGGRFRTDQGSEGACFPAGTLIRMADGSNRPIESVDLLDQVVTAEGRTGTVRQLMVRHTDELVSVDFVGHAALRCTPEHPVLTRDRGYVAAKNLTPDDRVAITRHRLSGDRIRSVIYPREMVNLSELRGQLSGELNVGGQITLVAPLPEILALTPDFGRLVGLYAAEGHTTANKVVWTFGKNEVEQGLAGETIALVKSAFDAEARLQVRPNGVHNVVLYGKAWRRFFSEIVPGTTKRGDKRMNPIILSGPEEFRREILDGWMDGDGHHRRGRRQGTGVAASLVWAMRDIANDLGLRPSIRSTEPSMNRHASTRQRRWDVEITDVVKQPGKYPLTDQATWRSVKSVQTEQWSGDVFNMHVEGDESYVANGVGVHNCVGFAYANDLLARPNVVKLKSPNYYARKLYRRAQQLDVWPGEAYEGTSVLAGAKALQEEGYLGEYRWAFGIDDVIGALQEVGPVVVGIPWLSEMYTTRPSGLVKIGGSVVGGHAILLTGYHPRMRIRGEGWFKRHEIIKWRNSWGPSYGNNGDAYIKVEDLAALLDQRGEACVLTERFTRPQKGK